MKQYIKALAVLIIPAISMTSCEDRLERIPKDKMTPKTYFQDETQLQLFTNDLYYNFPDFSSFYEESADLLDKKILMDALTDSRVVPATSNSWTFDKLRNINFFLANSHNCPDEKLRARYDGVARFFRAYFYYEKLKRYGEVPWVDRPLDSNDPELYKGRDSRETIMSHIIEDLDFAIANLPSEKQLLTVTKWTALALKSRVCLFEGTWQIYQGNGDGKVCLQQCISASEDLINNGGYSLYMKGSTPYLDMFNAEDADPTEIILARRYTSSLKMTHAANDYLVNPNGGQVSMLKDIVNQYLMTDGSRFTDKPGYEKMTFVEECKNRDKRLAQTIRTPGYTRVDVPTTQLAPDFTVARTGYQIIKYVGATQYDAWNTSIVDMPLFRLGETLLNLAEAKAELGTITQADLDRTINELRKRGGVKALSLSEANANPDPYLMSEETGYPNVKGANVGVILEIRRERTIELPLEDFRYWDIMRWKAGKRFLRPYMGMYFPSLGTFDVDGNGTPDVCLYQGSKPSAGDNIVYLKVGGDIKLSEGTSGNIIVHDGDRYFNENRDYLYPIPSEHRILSQGTITQNPGWDDGLSFE